MRIGFIGFGEAGRAFAKSLAARDPSLSFIAWDILLDDSIRAAEMAQAMQSLGVSVASGREALRDTDWIFSAVTADQSLAAVRALVPVLAQGQTLIDINSVAPDTKRRSAALVEQAGCRYLDMAVMAPVHPKGHSTPVLIAGPEAAAMADALGGLGFDLGFAGDEPGAATAIKMVRSLFVKGLEAITVETLLAAQASGCFDAIVASLSKSYPGLGWPQFAEYQFERSLRHGRRRAAEMRESAATVAALGLEGGLADAIADVQQAMGEAGAMPAGDLGETAKTAVAARVASPRRSS